MGAFIWHFPQEASNTISDSVTWTSPLHDVLTNGADLPDK